jgi:lipoyl(octanoyl) transferase
MADIAVIRPDRQLDYAEGLALQRRLHADVVAGHSPGAIIVCEHPSVYTAGKRTEPSDLPKDGSAVVQVDRGGRITWHGPGQLVVYPILRLPEPLDVVAWVRDLEQVLIDVCASVGVDAHRVDGRSGAWVTTPDGREEKVAAIGLRVAEGVTMHGVAINCANALEAYAAIVPCGIADAGVTTLSRVTGRTIAPDTVAEITVSRILEAWTRLQTDGTHVSRLAEATA